VSSRNRLHRTGSVDFTAGLLVREGRLSNRRPTSGCKAQSGPAGHGCYVDSWHKVRAQLGAFEGTETAALPTLCINGRFTVYGAGLEPMSALANSTFDRAGAANGGSPPIVSNAALFTKVAFGLLAAIRCTVHKGPQWAGRGHDHLGRRAAIRRTAEIVPLGPNIQCSGR
jgi:hypothetical protein